LQTQTYEGYNKRDCISTDSSMRSRWLDGSEFARVDYYGEIVNTSKAKPGSFRDSRRNELIKSAYEILNVKEALPADRQAEFEY
jgi:hypothetical protein